MRTRLLGSIVAVALLLAACAADDRDTASPKGDALLQVKTEGSFVPIEFILGTGPRYTLLDDGRFIFEGAQIAIFPGPLVPSYMVATLDDGQMEAVTEIVDRIGLPDIGEEHDDSAAQFVADAGTEVITYWDGNGKHTLSVYALGVEPTPSERNRAFLELIETFDRFVGSADAEPYEPEQVRIISGPGVIDQDFQDIRPWPLDDDWNAWTELGNGWTCRGFGPDVLEQFGEATQVTVWEIPDVFSYSAPAKLLVRPLHPGETSCP